MVLISPLCKCKLKKSCPKESYITPIQMQMIVKHASTQENNIAGLINQMAQELGENPIAALGQIQFAMI